MMKWFRFDADVELTPDQIFDIEDQIENECLKRDWDREKIAWSCCISVLVRKI